MRPTEGFKQLGRGLGFRPFGRGPTITDGRRKYTIVPALLFAPPTVIFNPPPFGRVLCFAQTIEFWDLEYHNTEICHIDFGFPSLTRKSR